MCHTRHTELDLAKGMGIIFMVLVHVYLYFGHGITNTYVIRTILALGRFPAAPVFMFCLGTGIVFSRHNSSSELFRRGIHLLISGYCLVNILSYEIPYLLLSWRSGSLATSLYNQLIADIPIIFCVDILQFAGLTFLYFALVKRQKWETWQLAVYAICFSIIGMILCRQAPIRGSMAEAICGLFWGTSDWTCFPFTAWILFPTAGYIFTNKWLLKIKNKAKFYTILGCVSFLLYVLLSYIGIRFDIHFANFGEIRLASDYYHMSLYGNVAVLFFVTMWISLCYFLCRVLPVCVIRILQRLSKHITTIYIIHYVLINYFQVLVGYDYQVSIFGTLLMTLSVLSISDVLASMLKNSE